jgi:hypothetical protein
MNSNEALTQVIATAVRGYYFDTAKSQLRAAGADAGRC